VVADSRSPRDGRFIEVLGTYDPLAASSNVQVDIARAQGWLKQGAHATDVVRRLFKRAGVAAPVPPTG
jgi:small subunit ribosomal protein S16